MLVTNPMFKQQKTKTKSNYVVKQHVCDRIQPVGHHFVISELPITHRTPVHSSPGNILSSVLLFPSKIPPALCLQLEPRYWAGRKSGRLGVRGLCHVCWKSEHPPLCSYSWMPHEWREIRDLGQVCPFSFWAPVPTSDKWGVHYTMSKGPSSFESMITMG